MHLISLPVRQRDAGAEQHQQSDAALAPGNTRATVVGRNLRVKWTVTGTSPSYDFQVLAYCRQ